MIGELIGRQEGTLEISKLKKKEKSVFIRP